MKTDINLSHKIQSGLVIDVDGLTLSEEDRRLLEHPEVAGVILFARNYQSLQQLKNLTQQIHQLNPALTISVDQEGGRVQRFQEGFTTLPAAAAIGATYDSEPLNGLEKAHQAGFTMASELKAAGVDLSFAPVLDLNYGLSEVVGGRSFHSDPQVVGELALAFANGVNQAGMPAVAKHFPGHGAVKADTHQAIAVDERDFETIAEQDLQPFIKLIDAGIYGIMPAHVIYSSCDKMPASMSPYWLQNILRQQLSFNGKIFSDDLSMFAAASLGDIKQRVAQAKTAGCDFCLICNDRAAVKHLLGVKD